MSQGTWAPLEVSEDFLITLDDTAITDAAVEIVSGTGISVVGTGSALTLASTVDEPGGVLSIDVTDNTADDGWGMYSVPFRPADGGVVFECRVKSNDISGTAWFAGFQETFTVAEPVFPFTMATTVITVVDTGVTAGVFVDHNATNEDWHFGAAQDANGATGVDLSDPPVGGGRAGADLSTATGDDEWIVFRVEIDVDGTARGYVGSSHNDADGHGFRLIGSTSRGALDPTAMVYPIILMENNAGAGITGEVDYYRVRSMRDWSV